MQKLKLAYLSLVFLCTIWTNHSSNIFCQIAPRSAQKEAGNPRDLFLYAMKNALSVVVGGHDVRVVGVNHKGVGALLNCAKYRRKREEGLFS